MKKYIIAPVLASRTVEADDTDTPATVWNREKSRYPTGRRVVVIDEQGRAITFKKK